MYVYEQFPILNFNRRCGIYIWIKYYIYIWSYIYRFYIQVTWIGLIRITPIANDLYRQYQFNRQLIPQSRENYQIYSMLVKLHALKDI